MKPRKITDISIKELSLILPEFKGKEWEPINQDAQVLMVKGGEKKSKIAEAFETLKAYFSSNSDLTPVQPFPVTEAADNIDNDGDGPADYNAIISAVCCLYNDLSQAYGISDDVARSAAMVNAIDSFLTGLDALRKGDDEKAGARHSKSDAAHIAALAEAHKAMGEHIAALQPEQKNTEDGKAAEVPSVQDDIENLVDIAVKSCIRGEMTEDGVPSSITIASSPDSNIAKLALEKASKEPYGDVTYADPGYQDDGKKRYPLDTEEHVRAAASYFGMEKNRSKYTEEQQKEIDARIAAAEKKFGIGKAAPVGEIDMTQDELKALVADAATKAAQAAAESVKAELQPQIDAAKAEVAAAKAEVAEAKTAAQVQADLAEQYKAEAHERGEVIKAAAGLAAKPTASSATATGGQSRLSQVLKAQLAQSPMSHQF